MLGLPEAGLNYDAQIKTNKTNLQIAQETNAANIAMARETNAANIAMNKENNLLQQELAKQSHEWSTAANQLKELMAAGLTEQQARQAIAGVGVGSSSFPVATTQPGVEVAPQAQMPAPLEAPQFHDSTAGALEGSIFGALGQSLTAADGGALGWSVAQDYISGLMKFAEDGKIDFDNLGSPADLMKYASGLKDGDLKNEIMDFIHGDAAKKVRGFVPAQCALFSFLESNQGFKTQSQQIEESRARTRATETARRLTEFEIEGQALENVLTQLNIPYQQTQNEIASLIKEFQMSQNHISANDAKLSDIEYKVQELTSPYIIDETIGRAQTALAQYEIDFAYKRMNRDQIIHAMENDLDVQIAMALANKVYWQNQHLSESAFGQEAFKELPDGTKVMRGLYRIYGTCKRFGATPFTNATQAVTSAGVAAGAGSALFKILAPKPVKVLGFH